MTCSVAVSSLDVGLSPPLARGHRDKHDATNRQDERERDDAEAGKGRSTFIPLVVSERALAFQLVGLRLAVRRLALGLSGISCSA